MRKLTCELPQLKGYTENYAAATYAIHDEDHTLGNLLRWMIMKK